MRRISQPFRSFLRQEWPFSVISVALCETFPVIPDRPGHDPGAGSCRHGMNTAVQIQEVKIKDISVTEDTITAQLMDGRTISVPLAWSWRLSEATPQQRANWEIIADGHGVHWPDIDEDISAEGMLLGIPAPRPRMSSTNDLKSEEKEPAANHGHSAEHR